TPTLTVNSDGTFTFQSSTPGVYVYDVPVCVPGQAAPCPTAPLTITVIDPAVNTNKPVVNPDAVTIKGAASNPAAVTIDVKANAGPGNNGGTLGTPTITTPATSGTVSIVGGKAVYTPNAGFSGKDTFVYQVCESPSGLCQTATVTVIVLDPGAANTTSATDDYVATNKNAAVSGNVKTNDYDPEGNNQTVNFAVTSVVGKGSLTFGADGSFTFTPAAGFTGPVDFTYTTTDDGTPAASASGTLHLLVKDLLPDFTPNILIDGLNFGPSTVGVPRDFIVNIAEINHVASTGNIKFRIQKLSAFDITYSTSSGNSNVLGGVANSNGDWTFTEDAGYITVETSTSIPAFGNKVVGFKITRKTGIGVNTIQNINVTLFPSTGGEANFPNNIAVTAVTTN
ncbi:MAG: cadherin-like domain-containing protein, partial [Siphonobacter aquaeclarae]|nr:cadherin-like domain-containing protein [Siphonobacter aquaeclarae]